MKLGCSRRAEPQAGKPLKIGVAARVPGSRSLDLGRAVLELSNVSLEQQRVGQGIVEADALSVANGLRPGLLIGRDPTGYLLDNEVRRGVGEVSPRSPKGPVGLARGLNEPRWSVARPKTSMKSRHYRGERVTGIEPA